MVAAHSGCVDLNGIVIMLLNLQLRRSPLGLRGFKCAWYEGYMADSESQPTRAAWI